MSRWTGPTPATADHRRAGQGQRRDRCGNIRLPVPRVDPPPEVSLTGLLRARSTRPGSNWIKDLQDEGVARHHQEAARHDRGSTEQVVQFIRTVELFAPGVTGRWSGWPSWPSATRDDRPGRSPSAV
ncbi:hypothetical protein HBB16_17375 [Pseudonocardia sp. MCCB 268]|nr:hypothetical protein [Pseudonocardia cytotoxica]